jgi:hypothetical protein
MTLLTDFSLLSGPFSSISDPFPDRRLPPFVHMLACRSFAGSAVCSQFSFPSMNSPGPDPVESSGMQE